MGRKRLKRVYPKSRSKHRLKRRSGRRHRSKHATASAAPASAHTIASWFRGGARRRYLKVRVGNAFINGIDTHYWDVGRGPTLVLLHGFGLDLTFWRPQMRFFAPGYRVIAYDLRGHGLSGGKTRPFEFMDWVYDLRALLDKLGVEQPYLCGHGLGAAVALQYATTYRKDVEAVVAADAPSPRWRLAGRLGWWCRRAFVAASRVFWPWSPLAPIARLSQRRAYSRSYRELYRDSLGSYRSTFKQLSLPGFRHAGAAQSRRHDNTGSLARIEAPTLLLRGTHDRRLSLREAFMYRHRISSSQLHHIQNAGHMTIQEQPYEFNNLVDLFYLDRLHEMGAWPTWTRGLDRGRLALGVLLGALTFAVVDFVVSGEPLATSSLVAILGLSALVGVLGYLLAWPLVFRPLSSLEDH